MAKLALAVLLLLLAVSASAAGGSHLDLDMNLGFLSSGGRSRRECRGGTVGECLAEESESLDLAGSSAESHRRALYGGGGYISYRALQRDNVPCSRRGASYYNCRPGAQANPYHRGCSRITRCRG